MASTLSALVTSAPESFRSQFEPDLPVVALPQGLVLMPLTGHESDGVSYLTPAAAAVAAQCSERAAVAYIEGETHGGTGTQIAVVWRSGAISWGPRYTSNNEADADDLFVYVSDRQDYAINAALRELGVQRGDAVDEYAALGLDTKRKSEDWLA
jgi:hypothetical protein